MLRKLERIGIAASVICGIHCLLTPLLVVAAPSISSHFMAEPMVEFYLIAFSMLSSLIVLGYDYLKVHHASQPLWIAASAWVVTIASHQLTLSENAHQILAIVGGVIVAVAFVRNWQIRRANHSCPTHPVA